MITITRIKTLWPEDENFRLERDIKNEYIFLHMITDIYTYINGKKTKLPAGSCFCYAPCSHQILEAIPGGIVHDWMHLSEDFSSVAEEYGFSAGKIYIPGNDEFVTELMRSAELEKMNGREFSSDICEMKIRELIARLVRAEHSHNEISPSVNSIFAEAREQIHMDYRKDWDIEQMAELVHLSPSRFFAVYKSIFGVSPKNDLLTVRMEHAKMLLKTGSISIKEAAEMSGYTNVYHFIRAFKSQTGKTPGKYKKS